MSKVAERAPSPQVTGRPRRSVASVAQGVVIAIGFVMLVGGFGVIAADYRPYKIPSASMTPTLGIGDTVLARKAGGDAVGRGDIVVFHDDAWGNSQLVKRVVGVGGDTVTGDDRGRLTVNGKPVDEPYLDKNPVLATAFTVTVPESRLFVLGDDRGNSLDSRSHLDVASGSVPASGVVARVEARIVPLSRAAAQPRTVAFDGLGGPLAHRPGPLVPAAWATVIGATLIVLASAMGGVVSLGRRIGKRRG